MVRCSGHGLAFWSAAWGPLWPAAALRTAAEHLRQALQTQRHETTVERTAYPVCIFSIVAFVPLSVAGMWQESASETLWKLAGTFGIVAFASALALSATRASKEPGAQ